MTETVLAEFADGPYQGQLRAVHEKLYPLPITEIEGVDPGTTIIEGFYFYTGETSIEGRPIFKFRPQ